MLPLRDENPTIRKPILTIALILACVAVYFFVQPSGLNATDQSAESDAAFTVQYAAIPCEVVEGRPLTINELNRTFGAGDPNSCDGGDTSPEGFPKKNVYLALMFSMFMHAGLLHIGGNMLFLWVFGNNIEDRIGPLPYLAFYLLGGLAATAAHVALDPNSTVPVVGASGAVAAVMGAYLVLYPRHRIHSLILLGFFIFFRPLRAWMLLGFWFLSQFFIDPNSGVAWVAHVGGFAFGVLGGLLMRATTSGPDHPNEWDVVSLRA
ncbi:MAG: rhomboid family intramembrane serine protease [Acidimicrobiales bacterium]|nr:rhomboid family intramembrane serine protease [Acidimicrobiales bacterium]